MNSELFVKVKRHLNYIEETIKQNKKRRRKYRGHVLHNKYENVPLVGATTCIVPFGVFFLLNHFTAIPFGLAVSLSCATGLFTSSVMPRIVHYSILGLAKGKLGRGYAKLELDNMFKMMKWFYKKNYKQIIKAKSGDEVSYKELNSFVNQVEIFAANYKNMLDKRVGEVIYNRNVKDFNKIKDLSNKISDKQVLAKKISKIIEKNNKFTKPWCDLFNQSANVAGEMFAEAKKLDSDFEIPTENMYADHEYLQHLMADDDELKDYVAAEVKSGFEIEYDEKTDYHYLNERHERLKNYLLNKQQRENNDDFTK